MSYKTELANLQRSLSAARPTSPPVSESIEDRHPDAHRTVAAFSAELGALAKAIHQLNPQLSAIQCWSDSSGGGARIDDAEALYRICIDAIPQPSALIRRWDLMRRGDYLHVMFFRNDRRVDEHELWLRIPPAGERAWTMTVECARHGGGEQSAILESRTWHSSPDSEALAAALLERLMRVASSR